MNAQRGGGDWMTEGYDVQRSSWVRADGKISPESMAKPGFEFLWKVKVPGQGRAAGAITPPVLFDFYIGYRGFRALGFVGSGANSILGLDIDLARTEWTKNLGPVGAG
ncbi:MAG: hypothetical protein FJW39_23700, partial [Acidobacteria bacterium]|nr:hypothetical protein [Acidobacteriota bacterium]